MTMLDFGRLEMVGRVVVIKKRGKGLLTNGGCAQAWSKSVC